MLPQAVIIPIQYQKISLPIPEKMKQYLIEQKRLNEVSLDLNKYCLCKPEMTYTSGDSSHLHTQKETSEVQSRKKEEVQKRELSSNAKVRVPERVAKDCNIKIEKESCEFISTEPPEYYNAKKAKMAPLKHHKYEVIYKQNTNTRRVVRYFVCMYDNCHRKYNKTWNFLDHVRTHTGEKPFRCNLCSKGFAQKGNFNKHVSLHHAGQQRSISGYA